VEQEGSYRLEINYQYTGKAAMQFAIKYRDEKHKFEILSGVETVQMSGMGLSAGNVTFTLGNQSILTEGELRIRDLKFIRESY